MSDNLYALVTWPTAAEAYEGYVKITQMHERGAITLNAAGVVTRDLDGSVELQEGDNQAVGVGVLGGSALGLFVGILGGPLGVLLGGASGALLGGAWDAAKEADTIDALAVFSQGLPPGSTGLIADVAQGSSALDALGGTVIIERADVVDAELAAAEDAADAAARAAREELREQKKAERSEKHRERLERLKAKHHDHTEKRRTTTR